MHILRNRQLADNDLDWHLALRTETESLNFTKSKINNKTIETDLYPTNPLDKNKRKQVFDIYYPGNSSDVFSNVLKPIKR